MKIKMKIPLEVSPEDRTLFRTSVGKVKPITGSENLREKPLAKSKPMSDAKLRQHRERLVETETLLDPISDEYLPILPEQSDMLSFCKGGIQHRLWKKLRKGQLGNPMRLDLHGMRVSEARQAILASIQYCQQNSIKILLIVHGRGNHSLQTLPILKTKINLWLRQLDSVLAFHSAQSKDGGTGATYVLLKSKHC